MQCSKNLLILFFFLSQAAASAQTVRHAGAMRNVMMGISLDNNIQWDTIQAEYLFGIGPLEGLKGEVTVTNSQIYVSRVDAAGNLVLTQVEKAAGPFGVYAGVSSFLTKTIDASVSGLEELETMIAEFAAEAGWDMDKPFLFLVEGEFSAVKIHVIDKAEGETEHSHEAHDRAKRYFNYNDIPGKLVGFYSKHHEGVFTHRGEYIHVHFIDDGLEAMGHLDDVEWNGQVTVWLPALH